MTSVSTSKLSRSERPETSKRSHVVGMDYSFLDDDDFQESSPPNKRSKKQKDGKTGKKGNTENKKSSKSTIPATRMKDGRTLVEESPSGSADQDKKRLPLSEKLFQRDLELALRMSKDCAPSKGHGTDRLADSELEHPASTNSTSSLSATSGQPKEDYQTDSLTNSELEDPPPTNSPANLSAKPNEDCNTTITVHGLPKEVETEFRNKPHVRSLESTKTMSVFNVTRVKKRQPDLLSKNARLEGTPKCQTTTLSEPRSGLRLGLSRKAIVKPLHPCVKTV